MSNTKPQMTEFQQNLADEATVFGLAGSMITVYSAVMSSNAELLRAHVSQVGQVFKNDPGFIMRYKNAHENMIKAMSKPDIEVVSADGFPVSGAV